MPKAKTTLREARLGHAWSIEELAKKAGIPYSTTQAIESGRLAGSFMVQMKLANALGLGLKDIWPETYAEISALMAGPGDIVREKPAKQNSGKGKAGT